MVRQELVNKGAINLNGDGRCDSPKRTAKFGTYTMDNDSGKVVAFSVVQVSEVTSSNAICHGEGRFQAMYRKPRG
ncbi:hypothetical protein P5673_029276 [Acropora cervicornis]|uniref:Uncharacterized protein n=1 Tax=Acropora cervicornis TaxID=6130 RepID=A0AAD9PWC2_ACRCE|nr:hypothetical protein P5673_029276 [Acropora cervicornis]